MLCNKLNGINLHKAQGLHLVTQPQLPAHLYNWLRASPLQAIIKKKRKFSDKCHRVPTHKQFKTDEDINQTLVLKVLKKRRVFREKESERRGGGGTTRKLEDFVCATMMAQLVAMASTSSVCGSNCAANAKSVSSASGGGSNKPEITGLLRCGQRRSKREIGCSSSSKGGEKEEVGRRNNNNEELMRRSTSHENLNRTPIAGRYHGQGRAELFTFLLSSVSLCLCLGLQWETTQQDDAILFGKLDPFVLQRKKLPCPCFQSTSWWNAVAVAVSLRSFFVEPFPDAQMMMMMMMMSSIYERDLKIGMENAEIGR